MQICGQVKDCLVIYVEKLMKSDPYLTVYAESIPS